MSGAKAGAGGGGGADLLIPFMLPLAAGALVIGGGIAVGYGLIRATAAVNKKINEAAEKAVAREMAKIKKAYEDLPALKAISAEPPVQPKYAELEEAVAAVHKKEKERLNELIGFFTEQKAAREQAEKSFVYGPLKSHVGGLIQKEIARYQA